MNIIFLCRVNDGWDIATNLRIMELWLVFIAISHKNLEHVIIAVKRQSDVRYE